MFTLLLAAAAAAAQAPRTLPLAIKCAKLTAAERADIEAPDKFEFGSQLAWYAREQCVSMSEARRRMNLQAIAPSPTLVEAIKTNEAATFAGLWIQHQPTYGVVVAFTRDAAKTLAKYTRDPLYIPLDRPAASERDLEETRLRIGRELARFGAKPDVAFVDVVKGTVEFGYSGDLSTFNAAVARGEVALPPYVRLTGPRPLPPAPALPADWRETVKVFPTVRGRTGTGPEPDILISGTMVLEDGCLRLKQEDGPSRLIVWPAEAALEIKEGKPVVIHRLSGERVPPGRIRLGFKMRSPVDVAEVEGLSAACPGPYVYAGSFGSMARYDAQDREERITWFMREKGMTRGQAEAAERTAQARAPRWTVLRKNLADQYPKAFVSLYANVDGATLQWAGTKAQALAAVPDDLRALVSVQIVPKPIAELNALAADVRTQLKRNRLNGEVQVIETAGRLYLSGADLPALSRAAVAGTIRLPPIVQVISNGASFDGYLDKFNRSADAALEAAPDFAAIQALIQDTWLPGVQYADRVGPRRKPGPGEGRDDARFLVALGWTAEDLKRHRAAGFDPVAAWGQINMLVGPEMLAASVRDAVVAELVRLVPERLGDGSRTTAEYRVVDSLKGAAKTGEIVRVRLISGYDADGTFQQAGDEPIALPGLPGSLSKGSRWLLFLSPTFNDHRARLSGGRSRPGDQMSFRGFIPVDGDTLDLRYVSDAWPASLARVRAALAPVDRAFDAAEAQNLGKVAARRLP